MAPVDAQGWDRRYQESEFVWSVEPNVFVAEHLSGRTPGWAVDLGAGEGRTDLFIHPPYAFRAVDALVTNFHLPKSTLIMMISAFAGREFVLEAYREAIRERYRFFSYGDCMLIL